MCLLLATRTVRADDYADLFRRAAVHSEHSEYEQALADYQAALVMRPHAPEASNNMAVILYQLHRYAEAWEQASKIWKSHPELRSAALVAGMSAVQCNRPRDAVEPLRRLLAGDPGNRDALLALASAYFALGDFPDAVKTYEAELSRWQDDATGWYGIGICYEHSAEAASAKLAHMPDGRKYSKLLLAQYLQGAGDDKLAAEAFGDSESDTTNVTAEAHEEYDSARLFASKAQGAFERVLQIAPESWQAAVFLGDVARQHSDLPGAIQHYREALSKQPQNPAALLGLGTAYWEMGDFEQASKFLNEARELNPKAIQALFELSNIAVRQHREAEAIPLLKEYLSAQPDALAARADLGRAYLHLGEYLKASDELSRAAAGDDRGEIHYQLSLALRKLGRVQEADTALQQSTVLRRAQLEREQRRHDAGHTSY